MTVVRNEFEQGENNPDLILNQRMMAVAFEWHNYGKSTIGNRSDIERVPIENLQAFYRKYYQPDNVVLIITGKFEPATAIRLMEKHFGPLPRPTRVLPKTYTEEPPQDGERTVVLRRVGKVAVVGVMYHIPAAAHPDNAVCEVLNLVLGDAPSGRLYKALVETKKATDVSVGNTNWHDPGVTEIVAHPEAQVAPEEVRDIILKEVESPRPFTNEEVERAVKKYLSFREQSLAQSKTIGLELSEWIGAGDWRLLFLHRDRVAKVTADDCNRVAAKYFKRTNRTVGLFIPTNEPARALIPEAPDLAELLKDYKGGKAIAEGEKFDISPANIEARLRRVILPSGVKVALLPKKTRGETVVGGITLHFGNEKSLAGRNVACEILGELMPRGTVKHSRQEIDDILAKLSSSLNVDSDLGKLSITWQSKRDNVAALLELVREILRQPTFPENEFDEIRRARLQELAKGLTDPQALAAEAFRRTINPYPKDDVRYQPTLQEMLERWQKVTRDDVVGLYREQLGAVGEVALVGDFDTEAVLRQLTDLFADWPSKTPYAMIDQTANTKVPYKKESINTPDKENAVYVAGLAFPMKRDDPDYPALLIGNHILGGSFTSRLVVRLRQNEGLCYGVGSGLQVEAKNPYSVFRIGAICNPLNINKVDDGAIEELTKLLKEGVSAQELAEAKKAYIQEMAVKRGNDSALAGMLQQSLFLDRKFTYYAELEKKIAALQVEDVNRALRTHLSPGRIVIIRAGDFQKKNAGPK
ncbi:MAG: insulinase family protein, partial [Gemmataceae bacterium]|nr:insulinase family protein [Gemmataceae bacterium]